MFELFRFVIYLRVNFCYIMIVGKRTKTVTQTINRWKVLHCIECTTAANKRKFTTSQYQNSLHSEPVFIREYLTNKIPNFCVCFTLFFNRCYKKKLVSTAAFYNFVVGNSRYQWTLLNWMMQQPVNMITHKPDKIRKHLRV